LKTRGKRKNHNRYRNLLVAATGTGKTVVSALITKTSEVINLQGYFVAHRKRYCNKQLLSRHFKRQ
jgi:superfamily II DNA or RNA helicase